MDATTEHAGWPHYNNCDGWILEIINICGVAWAVGEQFPTFDGP